MGIPISQIAKTYGNKITFPLGRFDSIFLHICQFLLFVQIQPLPFVFMWVENIPTQSHNAYDAGGDGPARKSFVGDNFVQKSKKANFLLDISSANEKYLLVYHLLEGHWIYSEERL